MTEEGSGGDTSWETIRNSMKVIKERRKMK
jgi:hypothetical protein